MPWENLDELDVKILTCGSEEQNARFIEAIQISEFPIQVEKINIRDLESNESFNSFKIIRGNADEELAERMDTVSQHLSIIGHNSKNISNNLDFLIEMMRESLGKQDQMIEI